MKTSEFVVLVLFLGVFAAVYVSAAAILARILLRRLPGTEGKVFCKAGSYVD